MYTGITTMIKRMRRVGVVVRNVWNLCVILSYGEVEVKEGGFRVRYRGVLDIEMKGEDLRVEVKGVNSSLAEYYLYNCPEDFNPRTWSYEQSTQVLREELEKRVGVGVEVGG